MLKCKEVTRLATSLFMALLLDADDEPGGIGLSELALQVPDLIDRLFDLFDCIAVASLESHADLGFGLGMIGANQFGINKHHLGVLFARVQAPLFHQGVVELRGDVLLDLAQIVQVPGMLQGAVVVACSVEELLQIKAGWQIEWNIAKTALGYACRVGCLIGCKWRIL